MDDLRHSVRQLIKAPAFTSVALLTLALGIGACTITFSMVNAVLLRPFPAVEPERLIALNEVNSTRAFSAGLSISYSNFVDWRRDNRTLSAAGLYQSAGYALTDDGVSEHVDGANVTAGFFELFGIAPALGRGFTSEEESASGPHVLVLSHELWTRLYAANPSVLGRTVRIDAESYTIIGVMPPGFRFPGNAALWTPIRLAATDDLRGTRSFQGVARLRPGVSLEHARSDLNSIAGRLAVAHPASNASYGVGVDPFIAKVNEDYSRSVLTLFAAVGCLLLITCVNVASLLLARGAAREREMALRLALGSSRIRIVRQLLVENLLLAIAGGALGLLLAVWGVALLPQLLPPDVPYWMQFTIDRRVLAFAFGVSVLCSVVFGLAPAWQLARVNLNEVLKLGGRSGSASRAGLMRTLVGVELALALVLLSGAGLMVKSLLRLQSVHPGFEAAGLLTFRLTLPAINYPDEARQREASQRIVERLQAIPGVGIAAMVSDLPLSNSDWGRGFTIAGKPVPTPGQTPIALNRVVSADYFAALHIPVKLGRAFDAHDTATATAVVIVDESFVRQYFPHENPLGQRVRYGNRPNNPSPWMEVVGVVGDVRHNDLQNSNPGPGLYAPVTQHGASYGAFYVMRLAGAAPSASTSRLWSFSPADPVARLTAAARSAVAEVDPTLVPETIQPMTELVRIASWRSRLLGGIFSAFAALALLLSALGVYGVTTFATAQRTREIGVRMSLGAQTADIYRLILSGGTRLVAAAIVGGATVSLGLTRLLGAQLYDVNPHDPVIFALVASILALTALLACYLPARRAARVDPTVALRVE